MAVIQNTQSVEWTDEERNEACRVLEKIAYCEQQGARLGPVLSEKLISAKKNISTEMVLYYVENGKIYVYLQQRPSAEESPSEPYPGQFCNWGNTHGAYHMVEDTFEIIRKKICPSGGNPFNEIEEVFPDEGYLPEVQDPPRGIYLQRIFVSMVRDEPNSPAGKWYAEDEIPLEKLVGSHRDVVLPRALEYIKEIELLGEGGAEL